MKRPLTVLAASVIAFALSGCDIGEEPLSRSESADISAKEEYLCEKVVGCREKPRGESVEFEMPEFHGVKFKLDEDGLNVLEIADGMEKGLYWGMPVIDVYLSDLNGDGKREICSTVAMGSGIVDERIYAYDLVHERLYTLQDRFFCNYRLELKDGALFYVQTPDTLDGEVLSAPLTLDKMTQTDKSQI